MKVLMIVMLIFIGVTTAKSAEDGSVKTGLSFLKIGIDARATGMASAYTAVAGDAAAVYWNPAGLLQAKSSNVIFNHNEWITDTREEFAGLSFVRQKSAWGFHLRSFNIGDIEVRQIPSAEPLENTSAHYFSAGMSYARKLSRNLDLGLTVKYLFEKIYVEDASGFGLDFGVRYQTGFRKMIVGAVLQNLGRMNTFRDEKTVLPLLGRIGLALPVSFRSRVVSAIVAADMVKVIHEDVRFNAGTEFLLWNQLALRTGFQAGYEAHSYNFGIGFQRSSLRLDYSILPFTDDLGTSHQFTLSFDI